MFKLGVITAPVQMINDPRSPSDEEGFITDQLIGTKINSSSTVLCFFSDLESLTEVVAAAEKSYLIRAGAK